MDINLYGLCTLTLATWKVQLNICYVFSIYTNKFMDSNTSNPNNKPCNYKYKNGDMCKNECIETLNYCQKHKCVKYPRDHQCRFCQQWIRGDAKTHICKDCRKAHPYEYTKDLRIANKLKPSEPQYEYIIYNEEDEPRIPRTMEEKLLYHMVGFC